MFAVIRTGGKQYRVTENDRLEVEKLPAGPGETVRIDDVLMIGGGDAGVRVGAPVLDAAAVFAEVVEHKRDAKVLVFKKRRRKNSRRLRGHRQSLTVLRITGISATGEAPVAEMVAVEPVTALSAEPEAPATDLAEEPGTGTSAPESAIVGDAAGLESTAETAAGSATEGEVAAATDVGTAGAAGEESAAAQPPPDAESPRGPAAEEPGDTPAADPGAPPGKRE